MFAEHRPAALLAFDPLDVHGGLEPPKPPLQMKRAPSFDQGCGAGGSKGRLKISFSGNLIKRINCGCPDAERPKEQPATVGGSAAGTRAGTALPLLCRSQVSASILGSLRCLM